MYKGIYSSENSNQHYDRLKKGKGMLNNAANELAEAQAEIEQFQSDIINIKLLLNQ